VHKFRSKSDKYLKIDSPPNNDIYKAEHPILARANYIEHSTLKTASTILSTFCLDYIRAVPEATQTHSTDKFTPFYIATQALFYLIIFREREIGVEHLRQLNLTGIVFSKLNPLASCVPGIAIKFCDVMKDNEIAYFHSVLEQV